VAPNVRYARGGDVTIAYQVVGDAPIDLLVGLPQISHLEVAWEGPEYATQMGATAPLGQALRFVRANKAAQPSSRAT